MKRVLAAVLLVAVSLAIGATVANAAVVTQAHKAFTELRFRTHAAALTGKENGTATYGDGAYGVDAMGGYIDSVYASGIAKFDTTGYVSTMGWVPPPSGYNVVPDSGFVCRLTIYDAGLASVTLGRTSATAESIYVKTQVSYDLVNWADCAIIPGQAPVINAWTAQTTVNASVLTWTAASVYTGVSGKAWSLRYTSAYAGAYGRGNLAPDIYHLLEYPYVRWIISGTRATTNHSYKARVTHWSADNEGAE